MNRFIHIARYPALAVLLLSLLSFAPAVDRIVVHMGETTVLTVDSLPGDTYSWDLYNDSTVDFAITDGTAVADGDARFINGDNIGSTAEVEWLKPGIYFYKVTGWNITGCTNNLRVGIVEVLEALPTATITTTPICVGEPANLTIEFTGTGPWDFTYTDGTTTSTVTDVQTSPYTLTIDPGPKITTDYQIISITDKWGTNNVPGTPATQQVNPKPDSSVIYKYEP